MKLNAGRNGGGEAPGSTACAAAVIETSLLVVRAIRAEIRRARPAGLSVTQLRGLGFLRRNPGASLGELASHLGLGAPTTSKLVQGLRSRGLLKARVFPGDRRRKMFRITSSGCAAHQKAVRVTRRHLSEMLASLSASDRARLTRSMGRLRSAVAPAPRRAS